MLPVSLAAWQTIMLQAQASPALAGALAPAAAYEPLPPYPASYPPLATQSLGLLGALGAAIANSAASAGNPLPLGPTPTFPQYPGLGPKSDQTTAGQASPSTTLGRPTHGDSPSVSMGKTREPPREQG